MYHFPSRPQLMDRAASSRRLCLKLIIHPFLRSLLGPKEQSLSPHITHSPFPLPPSRLFPWVFQNSWLITTNFSKYITFSLQLLSQVDPKGTAFSAAPSSGGYLFSIPFVLKEGLDLISHRHIQMNIPDSALHTSALPPYATHCNDLLSSLPTERIFPLLTHSLHFYFCNIFWWVPQPHRSSIFFFIRHWNYPNPATHFHDHRLSLFITRDFHFKFLFQVSLSLIITHVFSAQLFFTSTPTFWLPQDIQIIGLTALVLSTRFSLPPTPQFKFHGPCLKSPPHINSPGSPAHLSHQRLR